jgi:hypothetical protein
VSEESKKLYKSYKLHLGLIKRIADEFPNKEDETYGLLALEATIGAFMTTFKVKDKKTFFDRVKNNAILFAERQKSGDPGIGDLII